MPCNGEPIICLGYHYNKDRQTSYFLFIKIYKKNCVTLIELVNVKVHFYDRVIKKTVLNVALLQLQFRDGGDIVLFITLVPIVL